MTTLDVESQDEAIVNVTAAGARDAITFVKRGASEYLASLPNASVDVIFLDSERTQYAHWGPHPDRVLRPGGLMIIDNALRPAPEELTGFISLIKNTNHLEELLVPIGTGIILVRKS